MSGKADSLKTIFYALGANFAIFVAKSIAAIITGSGAMTAEAVHSLADCGNQGLLLIGMKSAKAPPSTDHPLGHGKAVYFWSFLVALMLFSVGGAFSIYEGVHKLAHPEPLRRAWIAVARADLRRRRRGCLDVGLPARGQQGARQAQSLALVPREPAERADRDFRRGSRRAARPRLRAGRGPADDA